MKLLIESFKAFLNEEESSPKVGGKIKDLIAHLEKKLEDPDVDDEQEEKIRAKIAHYKDKLYGAPNTPSTDIDYWLDSKDYIAGEKLGEGAFGPVYKIKAKHSPTAYAMKIVAGGAKVMEVDNYNWIFRNRSRLPEEVAKHLPSVYFADIVQIGDKEYGIVIMELLQPDYHKVNLALFHSGGTEAEDTAAMRLTNRGQRLFANERLRLSTAKSVIYSMKIWEHIFQIGHAEDPTISEIEGFAADIAKTASARYKRKDWASGDLELQHPHLQDTDPYAIQFAKLIIDEFNKSEYKKKLAASAKRQFDENQAQLSKWVAHSMFFGPLTQVQGEIEDIFVYEFLKPVLGLSAKRYADMDQPEEAVEQFPEAKSLYKAIKFLDVAGFSAKDLHTHNVMISKQSREMVIVDVGMFDLQQAQQVVSKQWVKRKQAEPWDLVLENFKLFLG